MKKGPKPYNALQRISAVFMMVALVWLTLSLPVIYQSQQDQTISQMALTETSPEDNSEEESNPLSNTNEEKNPNSNNTFSEEYLHNHHSGGHLFSVDLQKFRCENADTYIAYHGELHVPPPDLA